MTEKTLSIVKPDAVRKQCIGNIIARLEAGGLRVVAAKMLTLSREQAAEFYGEHRGRPFFEGLLDFMTSGPILAQVLEGDNAVAKNREMMGATDPANAAPGTLRADFADNVEANAVHGSDSPDTARREVAFFFPDIADGG